MRVSPVLAAGIAAVTLGHGGAEAAPMGVVEGFYGTPWSHQDRLDVIAFLGRHGLDLYIYAPKDDPGHRAEWRTPYGEEEMARFRDLAAACRASDVDLCFAVSPGQDMIYSDPVEQRLLLDKMMSLHGEGVTHFALFLDDIDVDRMAEPDRALFDSPVEAHVHLANALIEQIVAREPEAWLLVCPTVYAGLEDNDHWRTLRETLDPRIEVVWTGPEVISPTISDQDLDTITAHLGRRPFIWDNYPVNDYALGEVHLGPLVGRTPRIRERVSGYAANPMEHAHASMIAVATVADFLADPATYDPEESWRRAVEEVGGNAAEDLLAFADLCRSSPIDATPSSDLTHLVETHLAESSRDDHLALRSALTELIALAERLPDELSPELADDLRPQIAALHRRANAMELALLFMEGRLARGSLPALRRFIDQERRSDITVANVPVHLLFDAAVGLSPLSREPGRPVHAVHAVDPPRVGDHGGSRGPNQLIIYTPAYGHSTTGTNPWGNEAVVERGVVVGVGGNDSPIPADGLVVSGHGESNTWITDNLAPGVPVIHSGDAVRFGAPPASDLSPCERAAWMRFEVLETLAVLVGRGADHRELDEARSILREVNRLLAGEREPSLSRLARLSDRVASLGR